MAKMIRCIEGHVFDSAAGQCPVCGWRVSQQKMSLAARLQQSIPTGQQIKRVFAADGPIRNAVSDGIANLAKLERPDDATSPPAFGQPAERTLEQTLKLFLRSRTAWAIVLTSAVIALLIAQIPDDIDNGYYFIYAIAGLITVVFIYGLKTFLRSDVPLVLLLFGVAGEIAFAFVPILPRVRFTYYQSCKLIHPMNGEAFWYWAYFWKHIIPSDRWACPGSPFPEWLGKFLYYIIGVGFFEDTSKLVPVAILLLLVWALKKAPANIVSDSMKSKTIAWSTLDRATTLVMIAFASGVGFVLFETLGQYLNTQIANSRIGVTALVHTLPAYVTSEFPISLANGVKLTKEQWIANGDKIAWGYGLMKGLMLTVPRTIDLLTGHGSYAAIAAYYIALARRQSIGVGILLVIFGFCISSTLHGAWDTFSTPTTEAPLAMASVVVLLAVCVQALALDERRGFKGRAMQLGRSFAMEPQIPAFPAGGAALEPKPSAPHSPVLAAAPTAAGSIGTLVIEGTSTSAGRRVPLQRKSGRIDLAPDVACEVRVHPTDASKIGLKNLNARPWTLTMPDGRSVEVASQKSAVLASGAVIDFGPLRGRIEGVAG